MKLNFTCTSTICLASLPQDYVYYLVKLTCFRYVVCSNSLTSTASQKLAPLHIARTMSTTDIKSIQTNYVITDVLSYKVRLARLLSAANACFLDAASPSQSQSCPPTPLQWSQRDMLSPTYNRARQSRLNQLHKIKTWIQFRSWLFTFDKTYLINVDTGICAAISLTRALSSWIHGVQKTVTWR